ncbi:MAG TPA: TonB-dependent receptor [Caulobacterales bacterium]|nr:TonB-dependent receptor [Caulobacterales bacterium]
MSNSRLNQARFGKVLRNVLLGGASTLTIGAVAAPAMAQEAAPSDEIVVTGIRASLQRSMDIKRNSSGVVDAISSEDIGKFPDTNLAESLQRITGVSINRVNGEGSEVTVRGFGGGYNLVTLNGRTMPTANVAVVGGDQNSDFATGTSRSFDFSNLASEGVQALEVYKTGRASVASGGLGATINIQTARPLDNPGFRGSVAVKANHDGGTVDGDDYTPNISGLVSWTDPGNRFGVAFFGSYEERDSGSRGATVNGWNIVPYSLNPNTGDTSGTFLGGNYVRADNPSTPLVNEATIVHNAPADPTQLVAIPNDSRYHLMDDHEERVNAQLVVQFRPMDNLTLTADALYVDNQLDEKRTDQTNWFNRPFDEVTFDGNSVVSTAVLLREHLTSAVTASNPNGMGVKDMGFEQQYRATEDTLESFGFNAEWNVSDALTFTADLHHAKAESNPNAPNGTSSTLISIGAPVITAHQLDMRSGFPVQTYTLLDSTTNSGSRGNGNGVLDLGDLGTQVGRTITSAQSHEIDEIAIGGDYDFGGGNVFSAGLDYRESDMIQTRQQTQQTLGDWGINNVGDVQAVAPGLVSTYCLSCLFNNYTPGQAQIAFRANAVDLYRALSTAYAADGNPLLAGVQAGHPVSLTNDDYNEVQEDVFAAFAQLKMEGSLGDMPTHLLAGVRYESTEVTSSSLLKVPTAIIWQSDNDFTRTIASTASAVSREGSYSNVLPSLDFSVNLRDDLVGRISLSKTMARPGYGSLFASDTVGNPPRPTAYGGMATGTSGNPGLLPLESSNFDVSLEWYYGPDSYLSVGFYEKRVANFEGRGQTTRNMFGLRDPSSGAPGSRSGAARAQLTTLGVDQTDVNLFTMTALIIQHGGDVAAASTEFQSHLSGGALDQAFVDTTLAAIDITADSNDPLMNFNVTQPINNHEARLYGFEIAVQHFFGDTGFGVQANYTTVDGDVAIDPGADPSVDQFALLGLSDSANATLIYDKYGVSARLAYTWRDTYLAQTNRDSYRSPTFVDSRTQLDLSVSYDVTDHLSLTFDGMNLTEEPLRTYGRTPAELWFAQELDARYQVGARYKF